MLSNWLGLALLASLAVAAEAHAQNPHAQNPRVTVAIDAGARRHAITPLIYGVAFGSRAELATLRAPLNRSGGNNMSTYSYAHNARNLDDDWYFESYLEVSAAAGQAPDAFVAESQLAGAQPMLTLPLIGELDRRAGLPDSAPAGLGRE
jgi:hypothetical protein